MKAFGILFVAVFLLIIGGGLSYQIAYDGNDSVFSFAREQVDDPDGSFILVGPTQAGQLALVVGAALFGLVNIGIGIAAMMWFLDRNVREAKETPNLADLDNSDADNDAESDDDA